MIPGLELKAPTAPVQQVSQIPQSEDPNFSIDNVIQEASVAHNVDAVLIRSIIAAESGFQPHAQSQAGAIGYMQLMPQTAQELGYDAKDKEQNIHAGSKYISVLLQRYRNCRNGLHRAIAAYNAGPGNVDRYRGIPPFRETRNYVKRVLAFRNEFIREGRRGARNFGPQTRVRSLTL